MEKKKPIRWLVLILIGLAVLALAGVSFFPIFSELATNNRAQTQPSPTSTTSPAVSTPTEKLQQEEKGYLLVLEREPENQTALRGLVETRLKLISQGLSQVRDLLDPLEKLAKQNPEQTQFSVLLAQAQQQVGEREAAAQTYRGILAKQPGNVEALQGFVALLVQEKRPTAAIDLLQNTLKTAPQANQLQPNSVDVSAVQLLLGQVYVSQKNYDGALKLYNQLIEQNTNDFRPVFAKAIVFKEQGKTQEAATFFKSAEALAPAEFKDQIKTMANQGAPAPSPASTGQSTAPTAPVPSDQSTPPTSP